jgi:hypothetical protein
MGQICSMDNIKPETHKKLCRHFVQKKKLRNRKQNITTIHSIVATGTSQKVISTSNLGDLSVS